MKRSKKVENKECPYRDTVVVVRSGLPLYWCGVFYDKQECIFKDYEHDAGECSYYLFPRETREEEFQIKGWCDCGAEILNEEDNECEFCKEYYEEYQKGA